MSPIGTFSKFKHAIQIKKYCKFSFSIIFYIGVKFMIVMGLHFGHDASICIIRDGEILICLEVERLIKVKHAISISAKDIELCLTDVNLSIDDIGLIIFLPIKHEHTGLGFWHNDPEWYGLRHYFAFDNPDTNKLLMRRTKIAHDERPNFTIPIDENKHLQDEIIECKIFSSTQSFFLNNVRSVHSTNTITPNGTRIATIVTGKFGKRKEMQEKIESLIVRSAEKYKDYAVLWDNK